jgi:DNA-binding SARP family transcriptional activator
MDANSSALRIYALGTLRIESADATAHIDGARPRKPLELLLALIAAGAGGVSQQRLCEILWADSDGDAAYRALITTVFRLRRWLGCHEAICFAGGRVALSERHCWIDAWVLECALTAGGRVGPDTLALYGGPLCGDAEAPLVLDARERLRRKFVRAVLHSVRQLEQSGRSGAAVEICERAVEADAACEELHRELIALHGRQGESTAATAAYRRCRAALLRHFGMRPSQTTERALRDACRVQDDLHFIPYTTATSPLAP